MYLRELWVRSFRSYQEAHLSLAPGLTVLVGDNGAGKTNLLEAIGYLAALQSFRGAPNEALVRMESSSAVVRGETTVDERSVLLEAEIVPGGRNRLLVNKQPLKKSRDLREVLRVSVFSPDDLVLVKGGPSERRLYVDELLRSQHLRNDALLSDLEKVLRQRNALLKQAGGRISSEIGFTLDVWDSKLAATGNAVAEKRISLLDRLSSLVAQAYADIADRPCPISLTYRPSWDVELGLARALETGRNDDVRRGLSLIGPHRDDIELRIDGRPSRTHASQGEQRSLALALRLAGHRLLAEDFGRPPLLLLDDVFSELDPTRSDALLRHLPAGQSLLATAGFVPPSATVETLVRVVREGTLSRVFRDTDRIVDSDPGSHLGQSTEANATVRPVMETDFDYSHEDNPVETVDESARDRVK